MEWEIVSWLGAYIFDFFGQNGGPAHFLESGCDDRSILFEVLDHAADLALRDAVGGGDAGIVFAAKEGCGNGLSLLLCEVRWHWHGVNFPRRRKSALDE